MQARKYPVLISQMYMESLLTYMTHTVIAHDWPAPFSGIGVALSRTPLRVHDTQALNDAWVTPTFPGYADITGQAFGPALNTSDYGFRIQSPLCRYVRDNTVGGDSNLIQGFVSTISLFGYINYLCYGTFDKPVPIVNPGDSVSIQINLEFLPNMLASFVEVFGQ